MEETLYDQMPKDSPLVNGQLREQLLTIFGKLDKSLTIVTVVDRESESCREMCGFLNAVCGLSPRLQLQMVEAGREPELEKQLHADLLPVAGLYRDGKYLGVAFHGVPGGQEINSFVLAIHNGAGPGQPLEPKLEKKILALKKKHKLKVCVSLDCHHCPMVVTACQRVALLNPNIEAEMVDARLYPELVSKYKISNVPVIIVDDSVQYLGEKSLDQIVGILR